MSQSQASPMCNVHRETQLEEVQSCLSQVALETLCWFYSEALACRTKMPPRRSRNERPKKTSPQSGRETRCGRRVPEGVQHGPGRAHPRPSVRRAPARNFGGAEIVQLMFLHRGICIQATILHCPLYRLLVAKDGNEKRRPLDSGQCIARHKLSPVR